MTSIEGVSEGFPGPRFHEAVIRVPGKAAAVLELMAEEGILGGYDLGLVDAALDDCILVNVTETKTGPDIKAYHDSLLQALEQTRC